MRKKKWAIGELNSSHYYIQSESEIKNGLSDLFPNKQTIHLEIGCGKGVFTSKIAATNPDINFFAVDLSTDVLGCAKRNIDKEFTSVNRSIDNILLMRCNAENLKEFIKKSDCVERIYLNFSNPWPKAKHKKRRLTYPRMLDLYKKFLSGESTIYFKTDNEDLFLDSKDYFKSSGFNIVRETNDLINSNYTDESRIETEHERMFVEKGLPIYFLEAKLCN